MQKYLTLAIIIIYSTCCEAQTVTVPLVTQEQNEWCWVGCSKCMLDYYGDVEDQCTIAEYARSVITWTTDFGTTNCCTSALYGCNTPNYEAGHTGSIQDIIHHFHSISSVETPGPLTQTQIATQMSGNKLFVEHWTWSTGGGHFVVGHGISGGTVYYMNPWPGEGLEFAAYSTMVNDGSHSWDYTLSVSSFPRLALPQVTPETNELVYPNPARGMVWIKGLEQGSTAIQVYNATGMLVFEKTFENTTANNTTSINVSNLPKGIYILKVNGCTENRYSKLVLE